MPDASWGYKAEEGLKAVLGGENLDRINKGEGAMSPQEMETYILSAPQERNLSYSDESRRFAKAVLEKIELDNSSREDFLSNPKGFADQVFKDSASSYFDLTGFMFGWAVNAVLYTLKEKPIRNPAIMGL